MKTLFILWDFLEDKPFMHYGVYTFLSKGTAEFVKRGLDVEANDGPKGSFVQDWVDVIELSEVEHKLINHFGGN